MGRLSVWDKLVEAAPRPCGEGCPMLSTVVPTRNSAHSIALTLSSLTTQKYPDHEIIVLDAGSTDRTLDIVKSFMGGNVHLYSVTEYNVYEMFNRGASFASGRYVNFLFPGDFYISSDTLNVVGQLAVEKKVPDLIFGGCLLRDAHSEARILHRPFDIELLKLGKQPTSLQSCWWRIDTFTNLGKFRTHLKLRGGYDLMCRFALKEGLTVAETSRVLTDYDRRSLTQRMIMQHFWETLPILWRTFGLRASGRWWLNQKDLFRSFRLWIRGVRVAFFGR